MHRLVGALAILLLADVAAGENLQDWREVRLGRADVARVLADCYADEAHLRACVGAVDGAGRWARPARRTAARPDLPLENVPATEIAPGWSDQYRAIRRFHDALEAAIRAHRSPKIDFLDRLDQLLKARRSDVPAALFWASALEGALRTTDGFASLSPAARDEDEKRGEKQRIGFGIVPAYTTRGMIVREVRSGSPAEAAGLREGDHLLAVATGNGAFQDLDENAGARVEDINRLPGGVEIRLRLEREGRVLETKLARESYPTPNVESDYDAGIGYARLHSFNEVGTCADLAHALRSQIERGARGLILDLRGNPGGWTSEGLCVAGLFLGDRTIMGESKNGHLTWRTSGVVQITGLPLVVLVDAASASASEMVAGALQTYRRAWLVGQTTSGKATRQDVRTLLPGVNAARTTAHFVLPDGRNHSGVGITPDFVRPRRSEESAEDQFQPRVDDFVFANPAPRGSPWNQPRPGSVLYLERCLARAIAATRPDYQRQVAEDILRCEGVTENVTAPGDRP